MFSGILLMSAKWYMIYCNGVIVMVCVDGITITALQYFMPILKSSHFFVQSSFDHPSFILRSSFDHPSIGDWRMIIATLENH